MRIEEDLKLDFSDVLIRPKRSTLESRSEVKLTREFTFKYSSLKYTWIPIIAANMDHTGTFSVAKVLTEHNLLTAIHKFASLDDWKNQITSNSNHSIFNNSFISIGIRDEDKEYLRQIMDSVGEFIQMICIDVANGYSERFAKFVSYIRELYPNKIIMAGNVVTGEMTEELILSGADIVKVGIGPGSVCTTRKMTGVGYPQLSAIIECADAAHGLNGHICGDGGCTMPGDVAKAFAAGADFVMLGGMFAGHDECGGEVITLDNKQYKRFYGMSSQEAMLKHYGTIASYRASEGKSVNIPYRGAIKDTIIEILGGIRSACTYVGAAKLKELPKRTTFIKVTKQINTIYNTFEA